MTDRAGKKVRARRPSVPVEGSSLESLVLELYSVVCRALTLYGVPIARQQQLLKKTFKQSKAPAVSGPLLEQFRNLSDLLTTWLEELPYVDATGRPKVLPIRGRGATFESLARQFLPEKPLDEVVQLACDAASVGILRGHRIAVYGDPVVNLTNWPEATLAQTIRHVTHIIKTSEMNVQAAQRDPSARHFERIVSAMIDPAQFEVFKIAIRPQLNDLCERADRLLRADARAKKGRRRNPFAGGIGVYL